MPAGIDGEYARAIGRAVASARIARGMTQEELRRRVRNSKNTVSNWERGVSAPTVQNLRELCRVLEVAPERLLVLNRDAAPGGADALAAEVRVLAGQLRALRNDAEQSVPDLIERLREAEDAARRIGGLGS